MIGFFPLRLAAVLGALAIVPIALVAPGSPAQAESQAESQAPALATALATALANDSIGSLDAAYSDLYAAMREGLDEGQIIEGSLAALGREFVANPDFAAAEAISPGLIAEIVDGMRPIIVGQSERLSALYRPTTLSLFARSLTPEEARAIADFYRSDIGRKLLGGLSHSFSPDATLSSIQTNSPVTREQVQTDVNAATSKVIGQMSEAELMEIGRIAMANPALLKLNSISGGVQELRAQMENEPLTAEEDAAIMAVVEDVFGRRLGGG